MDQSKLNIGNREKKVRKTAKIVSGEQKDKGFSVKTTPTIFSKFTKINQYYGMSNNSVVNQLIVKYIRENQGILDELETDNK